MHIKMVRVIIISITLSGTFLKGYLIVLLRLRLHKHFDIKFRQLLIKILLNEFNKHIHGMCNRREAFYIHENSI